MGGVSKPKKMTPKRKKKFVKDSIDWLRENDPGRLDTVDESTAKAFTNLAGIPFEMVESSMLADDTKNKAMLDALDWLRGNDVVMDDNPDNDLVSALSKITGASMPEKMIPGEKKKFVEDSVDWLRENDPGRLDTVDNLTAAALTKLAGIDYDGLPLSTNEKKSKAMEDALSWLRKNDPEVDDNPDNDLVTALSKITGALKPKKMTPKRKKKFVKDSIDWLRENDPGRLDTVDEPTAKAFTNLAGIPFEMVESSMLADDTKNKAMLDALDWLWG